MDRIGLQILEDELKKDAQVLVQAAVKARASALRKPSKTTLKREAITTTA